MIDFNHLKENNTSYREHAIFAVSVGLRTAFSSIFFLIHGVLPFIQVPAFLNLEAMAHYYGKKNEKRS